MTSRKLTRSIALDFSRLEAACGLEFEMDERERITSAANRYRARMRHRESRPAYLRVKSLRRRLETWIEKGRTLIPEIAEVLPFALLPEEMAEIQKILEALDRRTSPDETAGRPAEAECGRLIHDLAAIWKGPGRGYYWLHSCNRSRWEPDKPGGAFFALVSEVISQAGEETLVDATVMARIRAALDAK